MKPGESATRALAFVCLTLLVAGSAAAVAAAADAGANTNPNSWDVASDTWVATDALGRSLPTSEQVGLPRPEKFVGVFYFLWLGRHGTAGPFDISKILARDLTAIHHPDSPLWGPLYAPHHWGESIFGYYRSDDEGVLRKHAQMLAEAGVDVVIFDVTNQLTYPESWQALCRVFDQVAARRQSGAADRLSLPVRRPAQGGAGTCGTNSMSQNLYPALWFRWEGKPLILADPGRCWVRTSRQAKKNTPAALPPGHTLGTDIHRGQVVSQCRRGIAHVASRSIPT